jgi:hypothetical protein
MEGDSRQMTYFPIFGEIGRFWSECFTNVLPRQNTRVKQLPDKQTLSKI